MTKLIFMIGISGSGKSSYIKKHFKPEVVVSPDDLRRKFTGKVTDHSQEGKVWAVVPKLLQQKLDKYGEAVLDATNVDSKNRANILNNFDRNVVKRIAIIFDVNPEEAKKRVNADIAAGVDRSQVPEDIIDNQYIKFKRGYNTIKQQFDEILYADKEEKTEELYLEAQKLKKIHNSVFEYLKDNYDVEGGDCYQIALALQKVFGGVFIAIVRDDEPEYFHHVAIRLPDKKIIDGNGYTTENRLINNYSGYDEETEQDFDAFIIEVDEYSVRRQIGRANSGDDNSEKIKNDIENILKNIKTESIMKKKDIEKIKKMIFKEMCRLKEEDAKEAQERAQYQSYQDIYLVPQSHWRLKKYTNMYDANGNLYRGKLGEVHRLQRVEYDFMHTGEVVTECGDETYSLDANDFRECFEMVNDEEGLKVNNENVVKEEIKKFVKIKDYFGRNIKESIEKLEKTFLTEDDIWKN